MKNIYRALLVTMALCVSGFAYADIDLVHGGSGYYRVFGTLAGGAYDNSVLVFTSQEQNGNVDNLVGHYYWWRWGYYLGTEHFIGTLDRATRSLYLEGQYAEPTGTPVVPWTYLATVREDGLYMSGIWPHYAGLEPGAPFEAEYVPVPEPSSLLALAGGLGVLAPLIRRRR